LLGREVWGVHLERQSLIKTVTSLRLDTARQACDPPRRAGCETSDEQIDLTAVPRRRDRRVLNRRVLNVVQNCLPIDFA